MSTSLSRVIQGPSGPIEVYPPRASLQKDDQMNGNQGYESDDNWGDSGPHSYSRAGNTLNANGWRYLLHGGGLGIFFSSELGWQIGIVLLVLSACSTGIALAIANRTILWSVYLGNNYTSYTKLLYLISGTTEFSYPITTMYMQLVLVHIWIMLSAYATRRMSSLLRSAGLAQVIAPSKQIYLTPEGPRQNYTENGLWKRLFCTSGGIAGGGLFEYEYAIAKQFLALAAFSVANNCLSIICFNHAQYPVYILARIGIVPLLLFYTYRLGADYNWMDVFFTLAATCTLGLSIFHPNIHYSPGIIAVGVFASIFGALYPVHLSTTWLCLHIPRLTGFLDKTHPIIPNILKHTEEELKTRKVWLMLHYISLLSVIASTPIVIISGELPSFLRNVQTLHGVFYWMMVICGSLARWAVFVTSVFLTIEASPLTVVFLFVPEASVLHAMTIGQRLPVRSWVALSVCWLFCVLYLLRKWISRR